MQSKRAIIALKLAVSIGAIGFLVFTVRLDLNVLVGACKNVKYLLVGVLCCFLAVLATIIRWWILVTVQNLPLGGFHALRLTMVGYFFNMFIPGGAGGDVVRAAYVVSDCSERKAHALSIAVADRGLGLHALLSVGLLMFVVEPTVFADYDGLQACLIILGGLVILATLIPFLFISDRTKHSVIRLLGRLVGGAQSWEDAVICYRAGAWKMCLAYLLSVGSAIFNVLLIHSMMLSVGSDPNLIESLIIGPLVIIANTLPISPGGLGVGEGASAGLFALIGQAGGGNAMLLARFCIMFFALLGLPFYLLQKKPKS